MVFKDILAQTAPTDAQIMRYKNLRAQAEKFVAQSFFVPIFKQMRNSPFKSELFGGGRGGEVFQGMLDGIISERMSRGGGKDLVDSMVKKLDRELSKIMEPSNKARAAAETDARARQFSGSAGPDPMKEHSNVLENIGISSPRLEQAAIKAPVAEHSSVLENIGISNRRLELAPAHMQGSEHSGVLENIGMIQPSTKRLSTREQRPANEVKLNLQG